MGAGIVAAKIPMRVTRRKKEEAKLKESTRTDNAIPPIPMSHS